MLKTELIQHTQFFSSLDDAVTERRVVGELRHSEGSSSGVVALVHLLHLLVVLGLEEVGQHLVVGPALVAGRRPAVEVLAGAADVHHAIHD